MGTFQGKVALITGGTRGIGRAISLRLAEQGAIVVANYLRNDEAANALKAEAASRNGARLEVLQANVGEPEEAVGLVDRVAERHGRLDLLIHNAAIGAFKPTLELKPSQWEMALNVNAKALLVLCQRAVPLMPPGSSIITISSLGAHRVVKHYGAIGVSKAALESLIRYLAVELAPKHIRVNAVSGGPIDTEALKAFPNYDEMRQAVQRHTPAGRLGAPEEIADVVLFLASDDARWIYGQTIIADGGLSLL